MELDEVKGDIPGSRMSTTFLGEPVNFWIALRESKSLREIDLIKEAVTLRAKVSYYEDHIKRMVDFGRLA
jgi:hypothetical protein